MAGLKPRKCKACKTTFMPARTTQTACGIDCAMQLAHEKKVKMAECDRLDTVRKDRVRREAIKPRAKWLSECQAIVNKIVRLRDANLGCCSCDRPSSWGGQWHASHLRSVGAASAVRFHLWNIHKACSICNNHLSGNLAEYQPRIRARIGNEKVDWLYTQNQVVTYDVHYLKRFKAVMSKKLRRMEKKNAI